MTSVHGTSSIWMKARRGSVVMITPVPGSERSTSSVGRARCASLEQDGRRAVMNGSERVLGDVATRLLYENERVRIWEMDLAPGARSATHRHEVDYVLV